MSICDDDDDDDDVCRCRSRCVGVSQWCELLKWPYHFNVSDEVCHVRITYLLDIHCKNDFDAC